MAMFRNQLTDLFRYEKITTTESKAKALRPQAERIVTLAKRGDLHARRLTYSRLFDTAVVDKLFHVLAPRFSERPGGYTRIIKMGPRHGDGAPMAIIQLVE
jgi:large subunit ribosomal protein L17